MPRIFPTIESLRKTLADDRRQGLSVAFVPTMGALHEGHLSLMREARKRADKVVVSIFVNPTQFGPNEDLDRYPRDPEGDTALCASVGVDYLFMPSVEEIYPQPGVTTVHVESLTDGLCGAGRPGHFQGVTTVVTKLFNIVQPDVAVFGQKDYQQLATVRRMVLDLCMPVEIVGAPTTRESDGIALSSRNRYLSPEMRQKALGISQGLRAAWRAYQKGERDAKTLLNTAQARIEEPLRIEYLEMIHPDSLQPLETLEGGPGVIAVAVHAGKTRLIDNLRMDLDDPGIPAPEALP